MARLVECVPNFSEGRRRDVIDAIAEAIRKTDGVKLLDVDAGESTNRTVYTFVGSPATVVDGALNACRVAHKLIDMRKHKGEHPRMGALDICPFVPVKGVSMDDCVECSRRFGEHLADELSVPVFAYQYSATKGDHRVTLPQIRAGEYEGLPEKLKKEEWQPDFGPATFVPSWGASVTGARDYLIAYNVNILGTKEQAHRIALDLREKGRGPDQPGMFRHLAAIGWFLAEQNLAQVSMNLTDYHSTGMHSVYEASVAKGKELKLAVVGSQLVGLVPLDALLLAADYYIEKEQLFLVEEEHKVRLAIERLGLDSIEKFNPKERIIEYVVDGNQPGPLVSGSLRNFILQLGARTASPGGGAASAAIAAMGAALSAMAGWLTYGKRKFESLDSTMRELLPPLDSAMKALIPLVDQDAQAYDAYMAAVGLPKATKEEQALRKVAMDEAIRGAVAVPLSVMRTADCCWQPLLGLADCANYNCHSDLQVGAKSLETGITGAYHNILINLVSVDCDGYRSKVKDEADALLKHSNEMCQNVLDAVAKRSS